MSYLKVNNLGSLHCSMRTHSCVHIFRRMKEVYQYDYYKNDLCYINQKHNSKTISKETILLYTLLNSSFIKVKNNKTRIKIMFEIINFVFKNCAFFLKRADIIGFYELCICSKGKRYFDYIYYKELIKRLESTMYIDYNLLFIRLERWIYMVNMIHLLEYVYKNFTYIEKKYKQYKQKQLYKKGFCRRGRKKRKKNLNFFSFNCSMIQDLGYQGLVK